MDVPGRSTSENTTPNPLTPAGMVPPVPGMENSPSVTLLLIGVNSRFALKGAKSAAYWGLIRSRLSRPPESAAWVRPVPGVVNVAPRVFWNTVNGVTGGVPSITGGPPPSQLISLRPLGNGPGALPWMGFPSAALNASTVSVIAAAFAPASEKMVNAVAPVGTARTTVATPTATAVSMELMTTPSTRIDQPGQSFSQHPGTYWPGCIPDADSVPDWQIVRVASG